MYIRKFFKKIPKKYYLHKIKNLSLDSKTCRGNDIFFAIKGIKKNGNKFINDAIKNGAKTVVSDLNLQGKKKMFYILRITMLEN